MDRKRPDGATVTPWNCGHVLVWNATCTDTYAPSHVALAAREAGAVAEQAEKRKTEKYGHLSVSHHFVPFACLDQRHCHIGGPIGAETGEPQSFQFLLQGISVTIQ